MRKILPLLLLVAACARVPTDREVQESVRAGQGVGSGQISCARNAQWSRVCRHIPTGRTFLCALEDGRVGGCVELTPGVTVPAEAK